MDHSIAAEAMSRLSRLSQDVHRPIECGIPDHLSAEDRAALKKRITEIWGSVYFDLMVPLISQYPDLDPDRNPPSVGASRKVGLASKPTDTSRTTLGQQLSDVAAAAEKTLDDLLTYVYGHSDQGEAREYDKRSSSVRGQVRALRDLGQAWANSADRRNPSDELG